MSATCPCIQHTDDGPIYARYEVDYHKSDCLYATSGAQSPAYCPRSPAYSPEFQISAQAPVPVPVPQSPVYQPAHPTSCRVAIPVLAYSVHLTQGPIYSPHSPDYSPGSSPVYVPVTAPTTPLGPQGAISSPHSPDVPLGYVPGNSWRAVPASRMPTAPASLSRTRKPAGVLRRSTRVRKQVDRLTM